MSLHCCCCKISQQGRLPGCTGGWGTVSSSLCALSLSLKEGKKIRIARRSGKALD